MGRAVMNPSLRCAADERLALSPADERCGHHVVRVGQDEGYATVWQIKIRNFVLGKSHFMFKSIKCLLRLLKIPYPSYVLLL